MAVKRLWFFNAPGGVIDELQRAQIAIQWPFVIFIPPPPPPPTPFSYGDYIRSYLGDNDNVVVQGTAPILEVQTNSSYLQYLRSYLGDT